MVSFSDRIDVHHVASISFEGVLTTRYKFAKSDNPSKIDGVFCVMAGLVGGILIWVIAALAFSITA